MIYSKLVKTFSIDTLLGLSLFVVCEVALRTFNPPWAIPPTTENLTRGYPVRKNSFGLRGSEIPVRKVENEVRIMFIGNSTTFGTGVAEESIYMNQLQNLLKQKFPTKQIRVINGAVQGGSLSKIINFWNEYGDILKPDIVILGFSPSMVAKSQRLNIKNVTSIDKSSNIFQLKTLPRYLHKLLYGTYTYPTLDTKIRKGLYRFGILEEPLNKNRGAVFSYAFDATGVDIFTIDKSYLNIEKQLFKLKNKITAHQGKLLVLNIPSRFELSDDSRDNIRNYNLENIRINPSSRIINITHNLKLPLINLLPEFRIIRSHMLSGKLDYDPLYIPYDFTHLNHKGHYYAAEIIYRKAVNKFIVDDFNITKKKLTFNSLYRYNYK